MTTPAATLGDPIRQLLATALEIKSLTPEHRAEIHDLMEKAGQAEHQYQAVLDTPIGHRELDTYLKRLVIRGRAIVSNYSGAPAG